MQTILLRKTIVVACPLVSLMLATSALGQYRGPQSPGGGFGPSPGAHRPSPGGGFQHAPQPTAPMPGRHMPSGPSPHAPSPYVPPHHGPSQPPFGNRPNAPGFGPSVNPGASWPGSHQPTVSHHIGGHGATFPQHSGGRGPAFNRHTDPRAIQYSGMNAGVQPLATPHWQQAHGHFAAGRIADGNQVLDRHLARHNSINDWMAAVSAIEKSGAPTGVLHKYRSHASALARSEVMQNSRNPVAWVAVAKFALEDGQTNDFRAAANQLVERFPTNQHANYYAGISAINDQNWSHAEASLKKAKELGMEDESINQLLRMVIDKQRWVWQFAQFTGCVIVAWILGLAILYGAGKLMSAKVLRVIQSRGALATEACSAQLRGAYRWLINIAGVFYYLSLPVLVLVAIMLPLSIGYALLLLPSISLILVAVVLIAGLGGVITALSGLRACFVRLRRKAPGSPLTDTDAPAMWRVVREVAEVVDTRPVDEIRVTPGADLFVLELGGYWQRMHDEGVRVLVVGMRLFETLDETAFRSILAHEYGHFLHRDTAGGDVAMQIGGSMDAFALAIVDRGPVRWWDVSVHFLRFFHKLFCQLTFGASRLQEVRADYVAVSNYGPAALRTGLVHVIRQSMEFNFETHEIMKDYVRSPVATANFYAAPGRIKIEHREPIETAVQKAFNEPSTADDTHPSPAERVELARQLGVPDPPSTGRSIRGLLPNRAKLMEELNSVIHSAMSFEAAQIREEMQDAVRQISEYLRQNNNPAAHMQRAVWRCDLGEYEGALHDLAAIPPQSELGYEAAIGRATVFETMGDLSNTATTLAALMKSDPQAKKLENYLWLGDCLLQLGRHQDAVRSFTAAMQLNEYSLWALVGRGRSFAALGRRDEAAADLKKSLELFPQCAEASSALKSLGKSDSLAAAS